MQESHTTITTKRFQVSWWLRMYYYIYYIYVLCNKPSTVIIRSGTLAFSAQNLKWWAYLCDFVRADAAHFRVFMSTNKLSHAKWGVVVMLMRMWNRIRAAARLYDMTDEADAWHCIVCVERGALGVLCAAHLTRPIHPLPYAAAAPAAAGHNCVWWPFRMYPTVFAHGARIVYGAGLFVW